MKGPSRRVAVVAVLGLVLVTVAAVGAPSPATGAAPPGPTITAIEHPGPLEPVWGMNGREPTSVVTAPPQPPSESSGGAPVVPESGAESVSPPDGRIRVTNTTDFPHSAVGQIEGFQQQAPAGQQNFICTGWLIDRNSILTSGHCAFDATGPANDIIEAATFFAGRNRSAAVPFPSCPVNFVFAPNAWRLNRNPVHDWAVMNLATTDPDCALLGDDTGVFGMLALPQTNAYNNKFATVQGYPGDKPFGTHMKHRGRIHHGTPSTLFYPMDTFGGQSGSPIWMQRSTGSCIGVCGLGLHSYGFPPGLPPAQRLNSGPRFTASRLAIIAGVADDNGV